MKINLALGGAILAALAACEGVVEKSGTGPGAKYCDAVCECEGCSGSEVETCSDDIDDLSDEAKEKGCGGDFSAYLSCLESLSCEDGAVDDSGCSAEYTTLSKCMSPTPSCATVSDGVCDEPEGTGKCPEGTDAADCNVPPPPCETTNNGVCDEPEGSGTCPEGTDAADCDVPPTCATTNNGVCDEPEGSATCPEGTDAADCSGGGSDCEVYCDTIMSNCTDQNAQYVATEYCLATCATFPAGSPSDTMGNTLGCRAYHAGAAVADPGTHCGHAGPGGGGICGDYCESFCTIAQLACTGGNTVYPTSKECMFDCSMFPNTEEYDASDTSGDTFACRLYHVTIAALDAASAATHCSHITSSSVVCQ